MKSKRIVTTALLGSVALTLSSCQKDCAKPSGATATAPSTTVEWKVANTWTTGMPVLEDVTMRLADRLKKASGGRFTIRVDSSNKHKAPLGIFDLVRTGQYEMGHTASYYWKGKDPATPVLTTTPFGMNAIEQYGWFYYGGGLALQDKVYAKHGLYSFPGGNTGVQMGGWFNREINSVADLKGLKMRIPGLAGDVLARVGANPVNIPPGELYTALERGTIDALEWVSPAIDLKMGFHQVAKYYYTGWHEPAAELQFLINREAMDALPDDLRELLISLMKEAAFETLIHGHAANTAVVPEFQEKHPNIKIKSFPPAVLDALKVATNQVLDDLATQSAEAKEIIDSQRAYYQRAKSWTAISSQQYLQSR